MVLPSWATGGRGRAVSPAEMGREGGRRRRSKSDESGLSLPKALPSPYRQRAPAPSPLRTRYTTSIGTASAGVGVA